MAETTSACEAPPSSAKAMPPTQSGPAPAGSSLGLVGQPRRGELRRVRDQVGDSVAAPGDDLPHRADAGHREVAPGLLPAEPAVIGAPGGERSGDRIVNAGGPGDADQAPGTSRGAAREPLERVEQLVGIKGGAQLSGRERAIATSPVRAISTSPWGRTMRSKASILSSVPVTSIVIVRRETSTICARKISAELA